MLKPTYEPGIWVAVERLRAEVLRLEAQAERTDLHIALALSCECEARAHRAGQEAMRTDGPDDAPDETSPGGGA